MKGEEGSGVGAKFAAVYFPFFFFFAFYVLVSCVTGADPASHGVRLWRGGSASTLAFSLFFPFIVLVVDDRQGARRILLVPASSSMSSSIRSWSTWT